MPGYTMHLYGRLNGFNSPVQSQVAGADVHFEETPGGGLVPILSGGNYQEQVEVEWTEPDVDLPFCAELDAKLGTWFYAQARAHHAKYGAIPSAQLGDN